MSDPFVLDVPVKLSLEFVSSIRADRVNAKRKLLDDVVDKSDRVSLIVTVVDLKRPYPSCIIDRCVLIAANTMPVLSF